jgi:hypothetical protein
MRRIGMLTVLVVAIGVAVYAAGAWSASTATPEQKDIKVLKAQVKTLQKQVKKLTTRESDTEDAVLASIGLALINACGNVVAYDAAVGTWMVIDQISAATQAGKTYFPGQAYVDDRIGNQALCQTIGLARAQTTPPTTAAFNAYMALLRGTSAVRTALR